MILGIFLLHEPFTFILRNTKRKELVEKLPLSRPAERN